MMQRKGLNFLSIKAKYLTRRSAKFDFEKVKQN